MDTDFKLIPVATREFTLEPDTSACPIGGLHELIRKRAYQFFEAHGRQPGRALDDWLQAQREIKHHFNL